MTVLSTLGLGLRPHSRHFMAAAVLAGPVGIVPTFQSAGLQWAPSGGGPEKRAFATFRRAGEPELHTSLDLVWQEEERAYRGSLLMLESGADYEVTLWAEGAPIQSAFFSTWPDALPVAAIIQVPTGLQSGPLVIDGVHGSPDGYILYEPADGGWLDGKDVERSIQISDSSYVIVRGFKIRNTRRNPVYIERLSGPTGVNDVVIEQCEITNWGRIGLFTTDLGGTVAVGDTLTGATSGATGVVTGPLVDDTIDGVAGQNVYYADDNGLRFVDGESVTASSGGSFTTHQVTEANGHVHGFGGYGEADYAITTDDMSGTTERLIIQRNHIHTPRGDANSWGEMSSLANGPSRGSDPPNTTSSHPRGPGGIFIEDTRGNHVIRWNTIHGAPGPTPGQDDKNGHYLMDGIGGRPDGTTGSLHQNSDLYGNDIRYVWDDAIEIESHGINNRVWHNFIDETFVGFGMAPIRTGPTYLVGNVLYRTQNRHSAGYGSGNMTKGDASETGSVFVLHNTTWTPDGGDGGVQQGVKDSSFAYRMRNNIIQATGAPPRKAYGGGNKIAGDLDFELYQGQIDPDGDYVIGASMIEASPQWIAGTAFLEEGTAGQGDAEILPNIGWSDRGAEQTGQPAIPFGHEAGGG